MAKESAEHLLLVMASGQWQGGSIVHYIAMLLACVPTKSVTSGGA